MPHAVHVTNAYVCLPLLLAPFRVGSPNRTAMECHEDGRHVQRLECCSMRKLRERRFVSQRPAVQQISKKALLWQHYQRPKPQFLQCRAERMQ